jgi:hypothetical protein
MVFEYVLSSDIVSEHTRLTQKHSSMRYFAWAESLQECGVIPVKMQHTRLFPIIYTILKRRNLCLFLAELRYSKGHMGSTPLLRNE